MYLILFDYIYILYIYIYIYIYIVNKLILVLDTFSVVVPYVLIVGAVSPCNGRARYFCPRSGS